MTIVELEQLYPELIAEIRKSSYDEGYKYFAEHDYHREYDNNCTCDFCKAMAEQYQSQDEDVNDSDEWHYPTEDIYTIYINKLDNTAVMIIDSLCGEFEASGLPIEPYFNGTLDQCKAQIEKDRLQIAN